MNQGPFNTNPNRSNEPVGASVDLKRMIVQELFTTGQPNSNDAGNFVMRCRLYDGANTGSKDYFVCKAVGRRVGSVIYAFQPAGGTGRIWKGNPVEWIELFTLPPNPRKWDVLICIDDYGTVIWERPRFTNVRGEDRAQLPPG